MTPAYSPENEPEQEIGAYPSFRLIDGEPSPHSMTLPDSQPDNPAFIGMWESSGNEFGTPYVQQRETLLCKTGEVIIPPPNM